MKVELIDYMGNDDSVVNAARVSFAKNADKYTDKQNHSLIQYLATGLTTQERNQYIQKIANANEQDAIAIMSDKHHTHFVPFTHTAITLRVTAPIPVKVQCFKHKIGFMESEESRRYISDTPGIFQPLFRTKAENVKQGSSKELNKNIKPLTDSYNNAVNIAIDTYKHLLNNDVPPEQARFVLPQGMLTTWIWTGNLISYANFFNQRTDSHAQEEIRELAYEVDLIIRDLFPISWKALT